MSDRSVDPLQEYHPGILRELCGNFDPKFSQKHIKGAVYYQDDPCAYCANKPKSDVECSLRSDTRWTFQERQKRRRR